MGKVLRPGFTLLEIVIVVALLTLVGSLALVSFLRARVSRELVTTTQNVLSVLARAQANSLAGRDDSSWGVRLDQAQYVLFRGTTYASATLTEPYPVAGRLEIVNVSLVGGGQEVVFDRITGATVQPGTFELRSRDGAETFLIAVDASGKVYRLGTVPTQLNTRVVDMRHRNFDLGWSIQNSTTLALTFSDPPNPDTVSNIPMAPYFDPGKSVFDWSGTITVGSENQVMRIHATLLTGTNTILSVDRDCRYNTKAVTIRIDTNTIASYATDCQTVTVGAEGGSMSEP